MKTKWHWYNDLRFQAFSLFFVTLMIHVISIMMGTINNYNSIDFPFFEGLFLGIGLAGSGK